MNIIEKLMLKHKDAISLRQKELNQAQIRVSELVKRVINHPVKTSTPHLQVIETVRTGQEILDNMADLGDAIYKILIEKSKARSEQPEVVFSSS